jgi:hypothetical protein
MVVGCVTAKNPQEVPFVECDDVIEARSADRSNEALTVRILPRRTGCRDDLLDSHRLDAPDEAAAKDLVAVTQ